MVKLPSPNRLKYDIFAVERDKNGAREHRLELFYHTQIYHAVTKSTRGDENSARKSFGPLFGRIRLRATCLVFTFLINTRNTRFSGDMFGVRLSQTLCSFARTGENFRGASDCRIHLRRRNSGLPQPRLYDRSICALQTCPGNVIVVFT